jgi:hypothetical protein
MGGVKEMTKLREVSKFRAFNKSVDVCTGGMIGIHVFPAIDPEIYSDIDGSRWGMVYIKNILGQVVSEGAIQWYTIEQLEEEEKGRLLNAYTHAINLLEVE